MAIVTFWSDEEKETGQTMSMVALSTYMAIEHNYRILNVSANFKENTLENCYWDSYKSENLLKTISKDMNEAQKLRQDSFESGIEGLVRVDDLTDDHYTYDESTQSLIGNNNKRGYRLGDDVTFFKGNLKDLVLNNIYEALLKQLYANDNSIFWEEYKPQICQFIQRGTQEVLEEIPLVRENIIIFELLKYYRKYFRNSRHYN